MRKLIMLLLLAAAVGAVSVSSAGATPRGNNGKIVTNSDNLTTGTEQVYTVDPDGTDRHLVADNSEVGQWSPDGTRITLFGDLGELLFNVDDGSSVNLGLPGDLYPDLALFCSVWSPDGARLACEGFGQTDGSLNGVYTLRASDGGDLQRVTYEPNGDDCPSDYSPNGNRLVVTRTNDDNTIHEIDTVKLDGSGLKRLTPPGMNDFNFCNGSWSPQGNQIVFSAHVPNLANHSSVWVVHFDGSDLHRLPIAGPCGGPFSDPSAYGCLNPAWSPDGTKIAFARNQGSAQQDLYTVNADGSGLFQVTNTPDIAEFNGDWGTHPVTP
jgi:Tol biopolymer transport system component